MATALRVSFCFFLDAHLWCQISRRLNTACYFKVKYSNLILKYIFIISREARNDMSCNQSKDRK